MVDEKLYIQGIVGFIKQKAYDGNFLYQLCDQNKIVVGSTTNLHCKYKTFPGIGCPSRMSVYVRTRTKGYILKKKHEHKCQHYEQLLIKLQRLERNGDLKMFGREFFNLDEAAHQDKDIGKDGALFYIGSINLAMNVHIGESQFDTGVEPPSWWEPCIYYYGDSCGKSIPASRDSAFAGESDEGNNEEGEAGTDGDDEEEETTTTTTTTTDSSGFSSSDDDSSSFDDSFFDTTDSDDTTSSFDDSTSFDTDSIIEH